MLRLRLVYQYRMLALLFITAERGKRIAISFPFLY